MRRVLIAYTSHDGQTRHIAHHAARKLEDRGFVIRLIDVLGNETEAGADDCEAAIVAGPLHRGTFDAALAAFIIRHGALLNAVPSAFLPVSLSAASDDLKERVATDEIARIFVTENGWAPDNVLHVAGALHDRRMNAFAHVVLHSIVDSKGVSHHSSGNIEFTDWVELDDFLGDFALRVPEPKS